MASASLGFRLILSSSFHLVQQAGIVAHWPECSGEWLIPVHVSCSQKSKKHQCMARGAAQKQSSWCGQTSCACAMLMSMSRSMAVCPCSCPARALLGCAAAQTSSALLHTCACAWPGQGYQGWALCKGTWWGTLSQCHSVIHGTLGWPLNLLPKRQAPAASWKADCPGSSPLLQLQVPSAGITCKNW